MVVSGDESRHDDHARAVDFFGVSGIQIRSFRTIRLVWASAGPIPEPNAAADRPSALALVLRNSRRVLLLGAGVFVSGDGD
jgi:hypothetical protein